MGTPIWQIEGIAIDSTGDMVANSLADRVSTIQTTVTGGTVAHVTQTNGTFSYDETSAAAQDAVEVALTARTVIGTIWLDMVNVTQDTTIRAYHKIDGSNYRLFEEWSWLTTDDDGVMIEGFTARDDFKVTLQCGGGGGGSVNVPYSVV